LKIFFIVKPVEIVYWGTYLLLISIPYFR